MERMRKEGKERTYKGESRENTRRRRGKKGKCKGKVGKLVEERMERKDWTRERRESSKPTKGK